MSSFVPWGIFLRGGLTYSIKVNIFAWILDLDRFAYSSDSRQVECRLLIRSRFVPCVMRFLKLLLLFFNCFFGREVEEIIYVAGGLGEGILFIVCRSGSFWFYSVRLASNLKLGQQALCLRTAFATSLASDASWSRDLIIDTSICVAGYDGFPFRVSVLGFLVNYPEASIRRGYRQVYMVLEFCIDLYEFAHNGVEDLRSYLIKESMEYKLINVFGLRWNCEKLKGIMKLRFFQVSHDDIAVARSCFEGPSNLKKDQTRTVGKRAWKE
ncbi:hypothetical protein Tco_0944392 [Tanacetum coccineum]